MKEIILTKKEAAVLDHRLEVQDAIAEVWGPDNDNHWGLVEERVSEKIAWLVNQVFHEGPRGGMIIRFNPDDKDHLLLLDEVIDGNTMQNIVPDMIDHHPDDPEHAQGLGWRRAMRSIDAKFAAAGLSFGFGL